MFDSWDEWREVELKTWLSVKVALEFSAVSVELKNWKYDELCTFTWEIEELYNVTLGFDSIWCVEFDCASDQSWTVKWDKLNRDKVKLGKVTKEVSDLNVVKFE